MHDYMFLTLHMNVAFLNFIRFASGQANHASPNKISHDLISYDLPEMTLAPCFVIFATFQLDSCCMYPRFPDKATIVKIRRH